MKIQAAHYEVLFGAEGYAVLGSFLDEKQYSSIYILTDTHCNELCVPYFLSQLPTELPFEIIEIEAGEEHKTLETCTEIWKVLTDLGADRKSVIITVGGGVVTDLGGFVASVFKRGIDCINIPTTLLGMVDASLGGKTGVDLDGIKNQIGTFSMPKMLLIDVHYLQTLDVRQLRSGYAEMLKHGLISDKNYWNQLKNTSTVHFEDFENLIYRSVQIKNAVVTKDPNEKGERKWLNFGHTLGHAIETYFLTNAEKRTLLHGEAIAIGMILEAFISFQKGLLPEEEYRDIKSAVLTIFPKEEFEESEIESCLEFLKHDKKNLRGAVLFVLLQGIGSALYDQEVDKELIYSAFRDYLF